MLSHKTILPILCRYILLLCVVTLTDILQPGKIQAQTASEVYVGDHKLYIGAAYYPEVWEMKTLKEDIPRMKELQINVVRIGEFSWSLMEPAEGKYQFGWLHNLIDTLHENGIQVILGTPTATPPIWLAKKHPEIFRINEHGRRLTHGARRNCSYSSKIYRSYSEKICLELAREFGRKPGLIAWQTDNEFNLEPDYSEETAGLWSEWLKQKYGSIDHLNQVWATNLWSQHYDKFSQVPMPREDIWHHPALRLDWKLFTNQQVVDFQAIQLKAIRKYSDRPISHDGMPGQEINYPDLFADLDFMTTNVYHSFQVYTRVQSNFDRLRGYGKGMHWLFETAPNYSGGGPQGKTWYIHQPEGALRASAWMNYAMGGQGNLYWLWRQQPAGQEMPHGAIISAWGTPAANYHALVEIGKEVAQMSDLMMKNQVEKAEAGIFYSHLSDMGLSIENSISEIDYYKDWTNRFYRPLSDAFIHRDVLHEGVDISGYKFLCAPLMPMMNPELKNRLKKWVEHGGILMLGPMSGYRNEYWAANTDFALGDWESWSGIHVVSRIPIDPFADGFAEQPKVVFENESEAVPAGLWSEALGTDQGKILATYKTGVHDGKPAIVEKRVGKGKMVLLGTDPGTVAMKQLFQKYAAEAGIDILAKGNEGILVVPRKSENQDLRVVINLMNESRKLTLPHK